MKAFLKQASVALITLCLTVTLFFTGKSVLSSKLESRPANEDAYLAQNVSQNIKEITPAGLDPAAPRPSSSFLEEALSKIFNNSATYTATVLDAFDGTTLYSKSGTSVTTPASNLKLLTAAAALQELGPNQRFETKITLDPNNSSIIIVGGGDVLLGTGESQEDAVMGRVGIKTLAQQAAQELESRALPGPFSIHYDTSLYEGEPLNPHWPQEDLNNNEMTALYPLALNAANSFSENQRARQRPANAALQAAEAFSSEMRNMGVNINSQTPTFLSSNALNTIKNNEKVLEDLQKDADEDLAEKKDDSSQGPVILASGESASVADQTKYALEESDNYLAENLGHLIALATGKSATYPNAAASIADSIARLGLETSQMRLVDASGLAAENQISSAQLAALLRIIINSPDANVRHVLEGLPVAHLSGTLKDRYGNAPEAAGVVRAKTGTLSRTKSLTGYVVDTDNRLLIFSFIANNTLPGDRNPQNVLDRAAATLRSCGCR